MLLFRLFAIGFVMLLASPGFSVSISDVLSGADNNFAFSVVHSSDSCFDGQCGKVLDSVALGANGGTVTVSGGLLFLNAELDIGSDTYQASGSFDLGGLLDDSVQANVMLGSITLASASGPYDGVYFFEDRNYSNAVLKPNALDLPSLTLSLWGATNASNPNAQIGDAMDLSPGGLGIDLRIELSSNPIPEPGSVALYLVGLAVVGYTIRRVTQVAGATA
ncbi:MAG: hypothetical protein QNK05_16325 [Myxococcota bacterium]|nr:hypothetical protein [Myxococcota bacterium]